MALNFNKYKAGETVALTHENSPTGKQEMGVVKYSHKLPGGKIKLTLLFLDGKDYPYIVDTYGNIKKNGW